MKRVLLLMIISFCASHHLLGQIPPNMVQPNQMPPRQTQPVYSVQPNQMPPTAGQPGYAAPPANNGVYVATRTVEGATAHPQVAMQVQPQPQVILPKRFPPFVLTPEQQMELDSVLARWEQYSTKIKRYEAEFDLYHVDPATNSINQVPQDQPTYIAFGVFTYQAPTRFLYHVQGQWMAKDGKHEKVFFDPQNRPTILSEKTILDETVLYNYDFKAKNVTQHNLPKEYVGRGLADSPLPLIFGAKVEDMKRRFSMRIVTPENEKSTRIHIEAIPLFSEDQQEFKKITIILDTKTLNAIGMKKVDGVTETYSIYSIRNVLINRPRPLGSVVDKIFDPVVPSGWTRVVEDIPNTTPTPPQAGTPSVINPVNASPRNEVPLYTP